MKSEYETLLNFRQSLITLGENRLNFFLATVSGAAVGLGLINQVSANKEIIYFVDGIVLVGLFLLGIVTFVRTVERSIGIVVYTRGMNRIRRFFVDQNPSIKKYLVLPVYDDKPSFISRAFIRGGFSSIGLPEMAAIVNSIIAGSAISLLLSMILSVATTWVIVTGVIIFIITLAAHNIYKQSHLRAMEKNTQIEFPSLPSKNLGAAKRKK